MEFRDVWFRYGDDQPWNLRGANIVLPVGRPTALVGLNGAGKTTPWSNCSAGSTTRRGRRTCGTASTCGSPNELRHRIRAVFQDATSYDLTARENIALDDMERVEGAARRAAIHEVVAGLRPILPRQPRGAGGDTVGEVDQTEATP
ncbi:ATP-binding cassette domain-containing protein [Nonomuraea sp. KM90]|uniref:ATP-binding cassette domain-containing protein n=1 Tax=Nonomuraea sp. KM90 TaxID=3457428 RepID=UPI003FCC92E6